MRSRPLRRQRIDTSNCIARFWRRRDRQRIGKLTFTILSAVAENKRDRIRERIRDVKRHLANQGVYGGRKRPFGYDIVEKRLIANKGEQVILHRGRSCCLQCRPIADVLSCFGSSAILDPNPPVDGLKPLWPAQIGANSWGGVGRAVVLVYTAAKGQRKLAAILAADVVGSSRLTGDDEDRTVARHRVLRFVSFRSGSRDQAKPAAVVEPAMAERPRSSLPLRIGSPSRYCHSKT
jgi:hypothetical protein